MKSSTNLVEIFGRKTPPAWWRNCVPTFAIEAKDKAINEAIEAKDKAIKERDAALSKEREESFLAQCGIIRNIMQRLSVSAEEALNVAGIQAEKRGRILAMLQ